MAASSADVRRHMNAIIERLRYAPASFWRCVMVCGVVLAALYAVASQAHTTTSGHIDYCFAPGILSFGSDGSHVPCLLSRHAHVSPEYF